MSLLATVETTTGHEVEANELTAAGTNDAHTTTAPAESGVLGSLGINLNLFVFQLINFAIIASIIWFLILKPITKKMTERAKIIDDSLENAKKVEENLRTSQIKFQEKIDDAKVEAGKIIERATQSADEMSKNMKVKATAEIEALIEKAKTHISEERTRMLEELKQQTVEVVVVALEKMLNEKITDKKDQEIIKDLVKKIR